MAGCQEPDQLISMEELILSETFLGASFPHRLHQGMAAVFVTAGLLPRDQRIRSSEL